MKTRYNWDEFPEWANFAATDPCGDIYVSEIKPKLKGIYWTPQMKTRRERYKYTKNIGETFHRERYEYIKNIGETPDWKESLECRSKNQNT